MDFVPLEHDDVSYWTLSLDDGIGGELPLPGGAPGAGGPEPPDADILAALHALVIRGWKLDSVREPHWPEDHDEDEEAGGLPPEILDEIGVDDDRADRLADVDRDYFLRREVREPR